MTAAETETRPTHPENYSGDSPVTHACCWRCWPEGSLHTGDTYIARCGERITCSDDEDHRLPPENACPDCLLVILERRRCPRCGVK